MTKRGRERLRLMLSVVAVGVGLVLIGTAVYFLVARGPVAVPLRYGELVQALRLGKQGPDVGFRKVQLGHADIRGEVVTTDRVSTGGEETRHSQAVPFRTLRTGFQRDQEIYALLRDGSSAAYQGAEDDSTLRVFGNALFTLAALGLSGLLVVLMLRWMGGGGSPFSFGRSRARMYMQKDVGVNFGDVA